MTTTKNFVAAFCGATLLMASMQAFAAPKTLVFCSEGSPEGFNPAFYTAGTTFDASSRAIFNTLAEFKHGSTEIGPGLAENWTYLPMARSTPSISAKGSNSRPPKVSPRAGISTPMT